MSQRVPLSSAAKLVAIALVCRVCRLRESDRRDGTLRNWTARLFHGVVMHG
jgi:hypothetical protein